MTDEAEPEEPPPRRRLPRAALIGAGLAAFVGGVWLARLPLAEGLIRMGLGPAGAQTDFHLQSLDFSGVTARDLKIGAAAKPDVWAGRLRLDFDWSRGLPRIGAVSIADGGVRAGLSEDGISFGALSHLGPSKAATVRPELPDWAIHAANFHLVGETPFGVIDAPLAASGNLRRDFRAHAAFAAPRMVGPRGAAEGFAASFDAATVNGALNLTLDGAARRVSWRTPDGRPYTDLSGARAAAQAVLPVSLDSASAGLSLSADRAAWTGAAAVHALAAHLRATSGPLQPGFTIQSYDGAFDIASQAATIGGFSLTEFAAKGAIAGESKTAPSLSLASAHVRTGDYGLALGATKIAYELGDKGHVDLGGPATFNGPIAGVQLSDARTPLDLRISWGDGFAVTPQGCAPITAARAAAPGVTFTQARATLCPIEGVFAASDKAGALRGGFTIANLDWRGRMDGAERAPAHLKTGAIEGRLGGAKETTLAVTAAALAFAADYPGARRLTASAQSVTANVTIGKSWSVAGAIAGAAGEDTSLPGALSQFSARWRGAPRGDGAPVFHIENGRGRVTDGSAQPIYHPLIASGVTATLADNLLRATGALALAEKPATLGAFALTHDFATGAGEARATARDLTFSPKLQPYDVSEFARGLVDNVAGPIDADLHARWTPKQTTTDGRVSIKTIDLASSSLGPIQGLSGDVVIDDLVNLTTPPGQTLRVAQINPGIKVADGTIVFQLEKDQRIEIERAEWPFAEGTLAVAPTTIDLAGDETRLSLTLTDVDVAALTEALNINGLSATGRVHGAFPLVFTKTQGKLEHGRLEAEPGGGTISYTGSVPKNGGASDLAFDALRSFHYDNLSIDLNGDLDNELVTAINFTGVNREPINPGNSPLPVKVAGIPFKFNVTVRAPFMALANSIAGFADARRYLKDAQTNVSAETEDGAEAPAPAPK
jgi:hypothetical protein